MPNDGNGRSRTSHEGIYVYGIAEGGTAESFGPLGMGGQGAIVYTLPFRDIGAVVSRSPGRRYPVTRENSMAHERALEAVFRHHTVLPARFCTVADDEATVQAILEKEYDALRGLLDQMRNKMEVGLKAVFHEAIYKQIVERYGEIGRRRGAVAAPQSSQASWQLVEIGRMVEAALLAEKASVREEIVEALSGACCDFRLSDRLLGERMILNAAFLIQRDWNSVFQQTLDGLAERYGELVTFRYVDGFPPFSFVCLTINVNEC